MKFVHMLGAICLLGSNGCWTFAQDVSPPGSPSTNTDLSPVLKHRMAESRETSKRILTENIDLTLPKGTALQVVLDQEIRVQKLGQPVHAILSCISGYFRAGRS